MNNLKTSVSSPQFSLKARDFVIGAGIAVGTAIFAAIASWFDKGDPWNWSIIFKAAGAAFMTYIGKNFFDKPKIVITNPPEQMAEMVKEGDAKVSITPQ